MKRHALYVLTAFGISIAPAAAEPVPFRIARQHLVVDHVYVNRSGPYRFILDTGAQTSAIREAVAGVIGLRPVTRVEILSVGGKRLIQAGVAGRVTLAGHSVDSLELLIHDLAAVRQVDSRAQGVLGQNYLARFNYLLDVRHRRLSFDSAADGDRVPFTRESGRMVVRSGDLSLVLDSGAGGLVLFHDRRDLRATDELVLASAVSDASDIHIARLPRLTVGERTLKNLPAAVVPQGETGADGLLPLTLFDSIYVNNAAGYVVVR